MKGWLKMNDDKPKSRRNNLFTEIWYSLFDFENNPLSAGINALAFLFVIGVILDTLLS